MSSDNWKQKYLDQLDELENQERTWGQLEESLRQFISHLSLAASDSDKELGKKLKTLRAAIRKGRTYQEMSPLLDIISKDITALDNRRKKIASLPTHGEMLQQLITSIKFPRPTRSLAKEYLKSYRDINEENIEVAIAAFTAMISEALQQLLEEGKSTVDGGGLFGKLFQKIHRLKLKRRFLPTTAKTHLIQVPYQLHRCSPILKILWSRPNVFLINSFANSLIAKVRVNFLALGWPRVIEKAISSASPMS